ncbi:Copper-sensing transcriptional repressor CsoR [Pseudobythopirellula maris]|uniref:Copper-sensing transcriptional repressor CsoR n=2 Tax=Lacipirellulaceae TaxID=2691359 RepID=A0A5C5VY05_9BACT|nr:MULTISPECIES: metal-sensitive transcriptional regulator [Lacipirellulaceae]TWT43506.1 Copper-sensing transcriptional repressor CsoR [Botrimarina hoheduenensis]TWT86698.1 Copper-sensing transcriptional repressor CsoR [Pseudobythopirellula maris]
MLSDDDKTKIGNRLRRIAGQVSAVQRMIDEDAYCVETLTQIAAANGALSKVGRMILETHVQTCIQSALEGDDEAKRDAMLEELASLFQKYGRVTD